MSNRRRYLVLTDESARHPFRMSLPPHVLRGDVEPIAVPRQRGITAADVRGFLLAYCAAFAAAMLYIL